MTENTQYTTLLNEWLKSKQLMITVSTHANFVLTAENHLIPYFGRRKIGSITEDEIQQYILHLYDEQDGQTGGLTVKTIRDIVLVLRLSMTYRYMEKAIPLLNWDLVEYPKEGGVHQVVSLSNEQEQELIQCIYLHFNRK